MTTPTSIAAYDDCIEILERALQSNKGIRVEVDDYGQGKNLTVRLHYFRKLLRSRSMEQLPESDPAYGTTQYDSLIVQEPYTEEGRWWVRIISRTNTKRIEELAS